MHAAVRVNRDNMTAARIVPIRLGRFWFICFVFLIWAGVIVGRLFWLQVVRYPEFKDRAQKQQQHSIEIPPRRGVLYDRNLHELAMTVQVDSIYASPGDVDDKPTVAHRLSALVHTDPDDYQTTEEQIAARLASAHNSIRIARGVTAEISARVMALGIKGIYVQKEFQRFYPDNEIAAQVLGYVGVDDNGLGGIEQKFETQLHGVPGHMMKAMDARRRVMGSTQSEPEPGQSLVLTIDANIQFLAERALDHAMQQTHAANGTVVVQDVHTGQILALAIRPTFNPNYSRRTTPALLRNHAVSDVYEPGSTFKLVTYAAALEQHVAAPDDIIDCQGGQITIAGRVIHDDKGEHFGRITVHQALEHSSDVAAVKLALKLGPERFYQYVRDFGFGSRTGAEMPGETRGLLRPVNKWGSSSIGSIAMGQEVAVTPLQLVSMVSTIANGGVYLPPHVLMPGQVATPLPNSAGTPPPNAVGAPPPNAAGSAAPSQRPAQQTLQPAPFKPGGELPNPLPPGAHRVLSTLTAAQMRKMMEGVVLYGTGKGAQLNGYSSGGKTGTAQKVDPVSHLYSKTMHVASFAGIAPVNNPVIAVAVIIDNPKGASYYGAAVSAPVFAEVAQQVLEYLGVAHDIDVRAPRAGAKATARMEEEDAGQNQGDITALYAAANDLPSDDPLRDAPASQPQQAAAAVVPRGSAAAPPMKGPPLVLKQAQLGTEITVSDAKRLRVPSLIGLPIRKVIELSGAAGLEVEISGNGSVRQQAPAAGTLVAPGTKIVVRCGR